MWRFLAGAAAALLLATAGVMWWNGRAADPRMPPPPASAGPPSVVANLADAVPPEASEKTREKQRFDRYDKNRDGKITREEYLMARHKAFAKLDLNHDGRLDFNE